MHAFSVAPFDQNLSIDGKILSDDCATLGTLGVIPESVILLKVGDGSFPKESQKASTPCTHRRQRLRSPLGVSGLRQ